MFEDHSAMFDVPDDTIIWRYVDFTKFVHLLDSRKLYFRGSTRLEDPYEGQLGDCTRQALQNSMESMVADEQERPSKAKEGVKVISHFFAQTRTSAFINCWSMCPYESAALWQVYLNNKQEGVAIQSTVGAFKRSFAKAQETVYGSKVLYIDYSKQQIPLGNLMLPLVYKRNSFDFEKEYRGIYCHYERPTEEQLNEERRRQTEIEGMTSEECRRLPDPPEPKQEADGHNIDVCIDTLIHTIRVSPYSPSWFQTLVQSVTRKYGLNKDVTKSRLYDGPMK